MDGETDGDRWRDEWICWTSAVEPSGSFRVSFGGSQLGVLLFFRSHAPVFPVGGLGDRLVVSSDLASFVHAWKAGGLSPGPTGGPGSEPS